MQRAKSQPLSGQILVPRFVSPQGLKSGVEERKPHGNTDPDNCGMGHAEVVSRLYLGAGLDLKLTSEAKDVWL
jgi:hypothetical protein